MATRRFPPGPNPFENKVQDLAVSELHKTSAPILLRQSGVRMFNLRALKAHNLHYQKGIKYAPGRCVFCAKGVGAVIKEVEEVREMAADELAKGAGTDGGGATPPPHDLRSSPGL